MKNGFTLIEVLLANSMLLILVAGFASIADKTFEQLQLRKQKFELASQIDEWTQSKLSGTLNTGSFQENVTLSGQDAELHWQISLVKPELKTLFFQVKSRDADPIVLAQWRTAKKTRR